MRVLFTHKIPKIAVNIINSNGIECDVIDAKNEKQILRTLKKNAYDGIVTLLTDSIDAKFINLLPENIKVISNYAVGYNNIDLEAAKEKGIVVTNTPGVLTNTVAEHTIAMIFAVATRSIEADTFVRKGKFKGWEPELLLGVDLKGKTLGILGAGRIGTRVAEMAKCFGMEIIYYDIQQNENIEKNTGAKFLKSPEDILKQSDVLSIHLPLNSSTHHFINVRRLSMCKSNLIIVNSSRGPVIDENALIDVLSKGKIFGAALDVYENEPSVPNSLKKLKNVVLSPHTASASFETRNAMARIVADNIVSALQGGEAPNKVEK